MFWWAVQHARLVWRQDCTRHTSAHHRQRVSRRMSYRLHRLSSNNSFLTVQKTSLRSPPEEQLVTYMYMYIIMLHYGGVLTINWVLRLQYQNGSSIILPLTCTCIATDSCASDTFTTSNKQGLPANCTSSHPGSSASKETDWWRRSISHLSPRVTVTWRGG